VLSLAEVRFIAASVVLALEYCHHEVKVLYLDLSLESVIITGSGYVKLVDAALTKSYSYEVVKSLTFVSEHGWLSPEVVD
jgi:serine/threonine protein kinase